MAADFFQFRRFRLELDGVVQGAFAEFDGPALETQVELDAEGRPKAGDTRRTVARLRTGVANTRELFAWFSHVLQGEPQRRLACVIEVDAAGQDARRHELTGAWPVRVRAATLSADVMFDVDELELAVESWSARQLAAPGG